MGIIGNQFTRNETILRKPCKDDGLAIYRLIEQNPSLDLNSSYHYHLLSNHFADTCVVAEVGGKPAGFLAAYLLPGDGETLFVWQIALDRAMRGDLTERLMLSSVLSRPECSRVRYLETTVNPSDEASRQLFEHYARDWGRDIEEDVFLDGAAFDDTDHESEIRLRIHLNDHSYHREDKQHANF